MMEYLFPKRENYASKMRNLSRMMISQKVKFPLPWREGMKGRGQVTSKNPAFFTLTLSLSR
jgi:hypothetical protein